MNTLQKLHDIVKNITNSKEEVSSTNNQSEILESSKDQNDTLNILKEIKKLEALQKDEKPQRKTVNLPEKYLKSHLHPYVAQTRCFYRGIILRILYKLYEELRTSGKEIAKSTCDPNFESWLKTDQAKYTYVSVDGYEDTAPNLYNKLHKKYFAADENE